PRAIVVTEAARLELGSRACERLPRRRIAPNLSVALDRPGLGRSRRLHPLASIRELETAGELANRAREPDARAFDPFDLADETGLRLEPAEAQPPQKLRAFAKEAIEVIGLELAEIVFLKALDPQAGSAGDEGRELSRLDLDPSKHARENVDLGEVERSLPHVGRRVRGRHLLPTSHLDGEASAFPSHEARLELEGNERDRNRASVAIDERIAPRYGLENRGQRVGVDRFSNLPFVGEEREEESIARMRTQSASLDPTIALRRSQLGPAGSRKKLQRDSMRGTARAGLVKRDTKERAIRPRRDSDPSIEEPIKSRARPARKAIELRRDRFGDSSRRAFGSRGRSRRRLRLGL